MILITENFPLWFLYKSELHISRTTTRRKPETCRIKPRKTTISSMLLIKWSFQGYHCESDTTTWRVTNHLAFTCIARGPLQACIARSLSSMHCTVPFMHALHVPFKAFIARSLSSMHCTAPFKHALHGPFQTCIARSLSSMHFTVLFKHALHGPFKTCIARSL